jgi:nicotinate phosphoribosyltransferase
VSVPLAQVISESDLREQLDYARTLRMNRTEVGYLRGMNAYGQNLFSEQYLEFLCNFQLGEYQLERKGDQYHLEFSGDWHNETYWEIPALTIIAQLYARSQVHALSRFQRDVVIAEGRQRLAEKIRILRQHSDITICDFGLRRTAHSEWHDYVVQTLAEELPESQFRGTSNTYLAQKYGLTPMGTSAHELPMGLSALFPDFQESQRTVLDMWWRLYGEPLSIALSDTYGTPYFLGCVFTPNHAGQWRGTRQDSGDPIAYGEMLIAFYTRMGIDPREKLIVFSDGLTIHEIIKIADHFRGRIRVTFGWGTNLTNDLGLKTLSIVIKLIRANGKELVKLSDNIAKAIGPVHEIERIKRMTEYANTFQQACAY